MEFNRRNLSRLTIASNDNSSGLSEKVRNLFNDRAESWSDNYRTRGKLNWRLHQFCNVVVEAASPPARVLDFGCGTGQLAKHLEKRNYQVTACDIADRMIVKARQNFRDSGIVWIRLAANWQRLPLAARTFDAVVASSVLEYVAEPEKVFRELARVLRDGGVLIFNVPNPNHARRKREQWFNRTTTRPWIRQAVCAIPRMLRFLTYLELSRNRFPLWHWETVAGRHGFHWLPQFSDQTVNRALFLFAFKKLPLTGGCAQFSGAFCPLHKTST